jgi:hypothetical protein
MRSRCMACYGSWYVIISSCIKVHCGHIACESLKTMALRHGLFSLISLRHYQPMQEANWKIRHSIYFGGLIPHTAVAVASELFHVAA